MRIPPHFSQETYDQGETLLRRFKYFCWSSWGPPDFSFDATGYFLSSMNYHLDFCPRYFKTRFYLSATRLRKYLLVICYRLMERLKSTLFCTVDCQHLKTRLLSTESFPLYRRVQGRSEMMEHEFLEQFISLTTTKLTANVYTEFSPYLSWKWVLGILFLFI